MDILLSKAVQSVWKDLTFFVDPFLQAEIPFEGVQRVEELAMAGHCLEAIQVRDKEQGS